MAKPVVAIVGRPNVGKSTLFNRLAGNRISIVESEPGITRDRIYADIEWLEKSFILVDTGGIETDSDDLIIKKMRQQAQLAIEEADLLLFVVDGRSGITNLDQEIADYLRKTNKKILLLINKVDDFSLVDEITWQFYSLGFEEIIPISAEHGKNVGDLLEKIVDNLPLLEDDELDNEALNIAIIGKPNVGKSSLVNYLAGYERVIVSDIPGTTRDAIDTLVEIKGVKYNLIDTAGMRRKARIKDSVEYYSVIRTIRAIDRADAVLMLIDATEGVTGQDKKIVGYAHDNGKAIVLAVNKWDLVEKETNTMEEYKKEIYNELKFINYAPITFISALTGKRVPEALELLEYVIDQNSLRIKTGLLNEVLEEAFLLREPPGYRGKKLKLYYATQVAIKPPTFLLFVNDPELMHFSYERYLENALRKAFGFIGTTIRINLKKRD
ncbi:MAG TPA: ribosome biogenesis GTPase Der [Halanaerobiaceae bacterium]|jgi:GTP-binding protein|nr:ribosome biogenesis GTPase Der [Bacillota bacterium]HHU93019.1 ribosome biogenesis GTPase Der [Halanaerobiaceae bacterium]HOA40211.1 ribosome biogenesis GTPase Der [Halanaerobiales bacterium]HPZ62364.1 ribosome biogenesis GTPase Der [Halanaerobiales bacterium]HQD03762.1 ribosome biogenesis GTPase Der [Halanaerobiales bacterium]